MNQSPTATDSLKDGAQDIERQRQPPMPHLPPADGRLRKQAVHYQPAVENNSFYITKTDMEGRYTFMDPFFSEMLGVNVGDCLGRSSLELIVPDDHAACIEAVQRCMAQPDEIQWVILRKPGIRGIITNQWVFRLLRDEQGNPVEFLCIGHEITDLTRKQRLLEMQMATISQQNSRLQNFAHIISHNIRSHVANLTGLIDTTDMDDDQDRRQSFGLIKDTVSSLDETIKHLNEIVNVQANTSLPLGLVNVKKSVDKVTQGIGILVNGSQAAIRCHFNADESIHTNHAYLESILLNLLTNAIKYRSPDRNPEIDIHLYDEGDRQVLSVGDNGSGLDLERYGDRVFELYKTFHSNADAKGMGLFMTKVQVEAMGGTIEVESELDKGTMFKIYFDGES